jgi:NADPH2:quinone reductase
MAQRLFQSLRDGVMSADDAHEYPFADAARAHEDLEARRTTGAVILKA